MSLGEFAVQTLELEDRTLLAADLICDRGALAPVLICEDVGRMAVLQQVIALDPSFDGDGLLQTGFPGFSQPLAQAVVLQPDGKIIACGGGGGDAGFLLAR
jgi:hypothetical protein